MTLKQTVAGQMKTALKSGDQASLTTLRLLLNDIHNFEIDHGEQTDVGVQQLVARSIKQWKDALTDYEKGGRADLVKEAKDRIALLEQFLPAQLSEDEIKKVVQETIAGLQNPSAGPVIGQVMKKLAGQADGGTVARLVNEALS
ncbi:MAG: hypothetical protein UY13_C0002G0013 [Candidatus Pacebacteria bacterium GW2011_GWB1_47_8]|nr:MAG: hypothetical protein UX28_C0001G0161 [Candidatus Pacebacteria bacterium GW2011_GWA1_46_10]KKU84101.1 MAG: hypothetical protein UY13_C0002G0013 [Candidatus Pacebacteria bacterium GW2011_GWB1_47_8]